MQITRPLGFDLLRESPIVDARLEDGSRVAVAYPPATPEVAITIRRFGRKFLTADDLVRMGSLPRSMLEAMASVASRDGNILIAGGTGSGKTTLLNAVVGLLPREDRIVVIEDTMEIRCNHPNCVRLEARGASGGGGGGPGPGQAHASAPAGPHRDRRGPRGPRRGMSCRR